LGTSCLRKSAITSALIEIQSSFYAHFKANKTLCPMTCYANIFSTVTFSSSSNLTFDLFLKMRYFNFSEKIFCAHVTIIQNICRYQVGTAVELGFVKNFTVKSHFTCIDEATLSNMFHLNSLHLLM
jgi:hypothetical protein